MTSKSKTEAYCSHFLVGKSLLSGARYDEALLQFKSAQVVLEEMLSKGWHADASAQIELRSVEENKQQLKDCVWLCENAANAAADVQFVLDQAPKLVPSIMEVRIKTLMKAAQSDDTFRSAGNFATWIEQQKADKAENYFQAGCLYAMCVADDKTNLDECVVAAIGSIEKARAAGYFDKSKLLLMNQNPAFVAVRSHPKFSSFVNSVSIEK